ncbi:MAG: hypothetical protein M1819_002188 [Sarea resinae]|nr:MAG: hypothetical protein M1819_002188 [Sarea resinae]
MAFSPSSRNPIPAEPQDEPPELSTVIPRPLDPASFLSIMADILRLPDETIALSFLYLNRYKRFYNDPDQHDVLDAYQAVKTLSLAALSLASKSTEAPRRLRELLLAAWRLLQSSSPRTQPLTFPSALYDSLRSSLVQAELILLRALKFELRIPLPLEFLPRYMDRTIGDVNAGRGDWRGTEDYEAMDKESREEYKIVDLMNTNIGNACRVQVIDACKNYQLANFFPARAVAAACLYRALQAHRLIGPNNVTKWLEEVTSGRVDRADFDDILAELANV